jgi:hypothetical protein
MTTPFGITIHSIAELNQNNTKDSHADSSQYSSLELNFRDYTAVNSTQLSISNAQYSRVRVMKNGEYLLLYMSGQFGQNVYYMRSSSITSWMRPAILFAATPITYDDGITDNRHYVNGEAVVLENGDIIAVAAYRAVKAYQTRPDLCGIVMKKSTDNGRTWSDEKEIYHGQVWEPSLLALDDGTVQLYFSQAAPFIYEYGFNQQHRSAGIGMLTSSDGGETWEPDALVPPYSGYRIFQQDIGQLDGVTHMADQMPNAVLLNSGKIAMAVETNSINNDNFTISVGTSTDLFATHLEMFEEGPADRQNSIFKGAAPDIGQFLSGETILSYNQSSKFNIKLGDSDAKNFGNSFLPFAGGGYWGGLEVDSSHSVIGTMPNIVSVGTNSYNNKLMIGRLYLNHLLYLKSAVVTVDGDNSEWEAITDEALFVGSDSQAQASYRFAQDDKNVYVLVERLDKALLTGDSISLFVDDGTEKGFSNITVALDGKVTLRKYDGEKNSTADASVINAKVNAIYGETDEDDDVGYIAEMAIPKTLFGNNDGFYRVMLMIQNKDAANEKPLSDFAGNSDSSDKGTWCWLGNRD